MRKENKERIFPRVEVGIIIMCRGGIVLIRKNNKNNWCIPRVYVNLGERVEDALERCALECLKGGIEDLKLFGTYSRIEDGDKCQIISIIYSGKCKVVKGDISEIENRADKIKIFSREEIDNTNLVLCDKEVLLDYIKRGM